MEPVSTQSATVAAPAPRGPRRARKATGIEHRQGIRQRVMALVRVHDSDRPCSAGLLYDLGADGMFVVSEQRPEINRCVDIELALSPAWDMAIRIKGLVIHHHKHGFGLMFREPDDPALALLEASLC